MTARPEPSKPRAAEPIDRVVSHMLSWGMTISFTGYAIGLVLLFLRKQAVPHTAQQYYHSLSAFLQAIAAGEATAFLYLGTVALVLTPFVLVLAAIPAFMRQRDKRFAVIAALVLMVMIASVIIGSVFRLKI